MNTYQEQLGRIRNKLQLLLRQYQLIEKENEKLREELGKKQALVEAGYDKTQTLEQQLNVLRAASGQIDESSKKTLEKQLNQYIREIDRCIAMMNE